MLILGLLGGTAAWILVEQFEQFFKVPPELADAQPTGPPEIFQASLVANDEVRWRNTIFCIGLFGVAVGGSLGLGAGLLRRSAGRAVFGLLAGIVLGGAFGGAAGYAELWSEELLKPVNAIPDAIKVIAKFAAAWIVTSVGIGLAVWVTGRPSFRAARTILTAAAAGLVAASVYVLLAALLFPLENSESVIPSGTWNRLFWTCLTAGLIGLALGRARSAVVERI